MSFEETKKEFTILAEWVVRKLRKIDFENADKETIIRWILYSLGIEKLGQDIYIYLRNKGSATSTEIAEEFNISPATARKYLEQLHLIGLVDYIGREYHLSFEDIEKGIRSILIPRINEVFQALLRAARSIKEYETTEESEIFLAESLSEKFKGLERKLHKLTEKLSREIWTGITVREKDDVLVIDIFRSYELTNQELLQWARRGKRIVLNVYGSLNISDDVDPNLLASVIERLTIFGSLKGPKSALNAILGRLEVYGSIRMR